MTETEKDDLKDIFMAKLQYNVRNDELIHIDYVDDAVNSLLQDLVKKLNIDDVSKCCCISRDTLTPEARKIFDDIDKALERK